MKSAALALVLMLVDSALAQDAPEPTSPRALVQRGMDHFRAARIKESIADFEAAARLAPDVRPELWQLGISFYYAGEFEKGRELFESHQTVNSQDVENAVWHFLCAAKTKGVEAARKNFITITSDRRVPMKEIHQLFAGKITKEEVLKAAQPEGRPVSKDALFYAHLYLGLYEEAMNRPEQALAHMKLATTEFSQPHYMGDVARVHVKLRSDRDRTK